MMVCIWFELLLHSRPTKSKCDTDCQKIVNHLIPNATKLSIIRGFHHKSALFFFKHLFCYFKTCVFRMYPFQYSCIRVNGNQSMVTLLMDSINFPTVWSTIMNWNIENSLELEIAIISIIVKSLKFVTYIYYSNNYILGYVCFFHLYCSSVFILVDE